MRRLTRAAEVASELLGDIQHFPSGPHLNESHITSPAVPLRFHEGTLDAPLLRLEQEAQDTQQRMRLGGLFYVLGWMFIVFAGGPTGQSSWLVGLTLFVLAIFRFLHPVPPEADTTTLRRWLRRTWLLMLASCLIWGLASAWILADPAFDAARTVVLFGCVALGTASAHSFSMRRGFGVTTLLLLVVPPIAVIALLRHETTLAWALLVFLAYLGLALERTHREWLHRLQLDLDLRRQRDQFARLSRRDGLTGLANRMHFDHALREAVADAHKRGTPLALLMCDVDHFKLVNDQFGHAEGDACLIAFSQRLQREFAAPDTLVARVGGEEFAVLLRQVTLAEASERAERFRLAVESQPMQTHTRQLSITISIGVAALTESSAGDFERLYQAADMALYRAKSDGRNRVCVGGDDRRLIPRKEKGDGGN